MTIRIHLVTGQNLDVKGLSVEDIGSSLREPNAVLTCGAIYAGGMSDRPVAIPIRQIAWAEEM